MKEKYSLIFDEDSSVRIDKWVSENSEFSRSTIQKLIKEQNLYVNNSVVKANYKLQKGDEITFTYEEEQMLLEPQEVDFEIIYEDDDIVVINKPLGLVVHPGVGNRDQTLVNGLLYHFGQLSDFGDMRPGIVHRIDKNTTGLLVVAKNNKSHLKLQEMIKQREVKREYLALVHGNIKHEVGTIDAPIGRDKNNRQMMCVCEENSKDSITHFEVIDRALDFTLIKCSLETGRTHQIRVHLKYINHPIVGDPVYGQKKSIGDVQLLHAFRLTFNHPVTNQPLQFEAKIPNHFQDVLDTVDINKGGSL